MTGLLGEISGIYRYQAPNFESPDRMAVDAASVLMITDALCGSSKGYGENPWIRAGLEPILS